MVTEQETLIYIEDQDKKDASVAANAFAHKDTKNRAYINTLGADLALKYLASENIDVSDVYNIHSIKKILEELDISDIMLPNIHIDVRVVFDENVIFIPKSHFEYNIEPDIYLVFNLAKDFSHVKFLGFFEPRLINKNNANDKYYFIEKEKLNSVIDLKKYIESHKGNTKETLSQEDIENSERIIISMADNDISENDKKYLIKQLTKSAELRDKFIEYENFETLSYRAMTDPQIERKEIVDLSSVQETKDISLTDELDNMNTANIEEIANEPNEIENSSSTSEINNEDLVPINEFSEINLEPIDNIENITIEDNINNDTTTPDLKPLEDIGGAIAGGIAAGATAAAAGEILNVAETADTALNITDTALNIIDSGVEIAKDLITDAPKEINPISFDNIDTSAIDNIQNLDENIKEETISLEDVKLPEETENTDYIDKIENKISFDDIETNNILEEPLPFNMDEEKISLDDIDTSNIMKTEENNFEAETLSLDNIDTSAIENMNNIDSEAIENTISLDDININENNEKLAQPLDINIENDALSFDNIDTSSIENITDINDQDIDNTISFDNIEEPNNNLNNNIEDNLNNSTISFDDIQLDSNENEIVDNIQNQNEDNIDMSDFMDDTMSLDTESSENTNLLENINEPDNLNLNNTTDNFVENLNSDNGIEDDINFDELSNIDSEPLESTIEPEIVEGPIENTEAHNNDSFGKNLMENLSADNLDDISIEDLGIDENIPQNNEDISSNDLLSQIDDILNSQPVVEETQNNTISQQDISNDIESLGNNTEFEDIQDISELATIDDTLNSSIDTTDHISEDANSGLITDNEFDPNNELLNNNIENTSIDDLLNFDDSSDTNFEEENNASEEDNIGVLFNDTDPTSDVELDEINQNYNQEPEQPQIPGAALLNNKSKTQNKKLILVAAALVTVIAAASAVMVFKPKNDTTADIEPIKTESAKNAITPENTSSQTDESTENILATNAPEINKNETKNIQKTQPISELKNTPTKPKQSAESYISVNKLVWDVPSNLSYSSKFQNYLRTAGKSIKLSLSADLLLAKEYAYTNQVKVNIKLSKNGSVQDAKVLSSSGSTEIDNIVLQSVKDTLNVVKPPVDEIKTPDFNLSLIIYF